MTLQIHGTKPATAHDITETLHDLPEAIYSSADLYARYRSITTANNNGHLTLIAFCRELSDIGYIPRRTATGHRAWLITAS